MGVSLVQFSGFLTLAAIGFHGDVTDQNVCGAHLTHVVLHNVCPPRGSAVLRGVERSEHGVCLQ